VDVERLGDQRAHRLARAERADRILEHHRHVAPEGFEAAFRHVQHLPPFEGDASGLGRQQVQHRAAERGLARTALPDEPDGLPRLDAERDAEHRVDERVLDTGQLRLEPAHRAETHAQVGDRQQVRARHRRLLLHRVVRGPVAEDGDDLPRRRPVGIAPLPFQQMAARLRAGARARERRRGAAAQIHRARTARCEDAALGRTGEVRHLARDDGQHTALARNPRRIAFQQRAGIGMAGIVEDLAHIAGLHHLARIHHHHLVAQFRDQPQIVGDDDHGRLQFALQFAQQMDDLRLHGDVERRRRLVRQQQRRVHQKRHRDAGALAHAAGEMVRILVDARGRIGDADAAHHLDRELAFLRRVQVAPAVEDVQHLPAVCQHRNLRGHRVLEDDRDLLAPDRAALRFRERQDVLRAEADRAALHLRIVGEQPEDRPEHRALARSAFADDAEDTVARHREADLTQRLDASARRPEIERQIADVEQRFRHVSPPS
jgi:hypothetical protein